MRPRSILAVAVSCLMFCAGSGWADSDGYVLGDDDGFGTGSSVHPGDEINITVGWDEYSLVADGDGTDELIPGSIDPQDFVFTYEKFSSITACSLFVQYIDWPESQAGFLWINGHKTSYEFPRLAAWDQVSPWDVLGVTIDLMPYVDYLYNGQVIFNLLGESTDAYIVDYMTLSIKGAFAIDRHSIKSSATHGGSVSSPGEGSFNYDHGTSVPIIAIADAHYHFTGWTGTAVAAGKVANPAAANTTLTADAAYTVQANFAIDRHTVTISTTPGGSVSAPGIGSFQYDYDSIVPIIAIAETNYHFTGWTGTAVDAGKVANPSLATTTFALDADHTLQANFAIDRRTLSVSATAGGQVIAPGEGAFEYDHGEVVALQAQPDPLFTFVGWRGNVFTSSNPYSLAIDGDLVLTAHFESVLDVLYVDNDAAGDPGPDDPNVSDPQENGTAEHPFDRVQEALDVARTGVRIMVRPGTYFETIDLLGKSIEVNGLNADDASILPLPVIDGRGKGTVVRCVHREDPNCILRGLVITGGRGWLGGGIQCVGSSPTIQNCLIVGNRAMSLDAGGGVHCQDSNAVFVNCTIASNCGGSAGAGVCLSQSNATMLDSIVCENMPAQIRLLGDSSPVVAYTAVAGGWPGDGILDADPRFIQPGYWADPADILKALPATDPSAVWVDGDYHLMSQAGRWDPLSQAWTKDAVTSPFIDAGDPIAPTGQEPSPTGGRINLGVYGGTSQASLSAGDG